MPRQLQRRRYRFLGQRYWILISASIAAGLALLYFGQDVKGALGSLVLAIASAFVTLGIVTFASEFPLKTAFTDDILEIVGLDQDVYNKGISQVSEEKDVDWPQLLESATTVTVVALRPYQWHARAWQHVLAQARRSKCQVEVIMINPDSEAAERVAMRLGFAPTSYSEQIRQVTEQVANEWRRGKNGADRYPNGSSLSIEYMNAEPSHSFARVNDRSMLILEPLLAASGSQSTLCVLFRDMDGAEFPDGWMKAAVEDVKKTFDKAPGYTDAGQRSRKTQNRAGRNSNSGSLQTATQVSSATQPTGGGPNAHG